MDCRSRGVEPSMNELDMASWFIYVYIYKYIHTHTYLNHRNCVHPRLEKGENRWRTGGGGEGKSGIVELLRTFGDTDSLISNNIETTKKNLLSRSSMVWMKPCSCFFFLLLLSVFAWIFLGCQMPVEGSVLLIGSINSFIFFWGSETNLIFSLRLVWPFVASNAPGGIDGYTCIFDQIPFSLSEMTAMPQNPDVWTHIHTYVWFQNNMHEIPWIYYTLKSEIYICVCVCVKHAGLD